MKKSDLLAKIANLLTAADHLPDDCDIMGISICGITADLPSMHVDKCTSIDWSQARRERISLSAVTETVEVSGCGIMRVVMKPVRE